MRQNRAATTLCQQRVAKTNMRQKRAATITTQLQQWEQGCGRTRTHTDMMSTTRRSLPTTRASPQQFTALMLDTMVEAVLKEAYAASTWKRRQAIRKWWARFQEACSEATPLRFFAWLGSNGILASSLLTYIRTFLAMFPHQKSAETAMFIRALSRTGGLIATRQAPPLRTVDAQRLCQSLPQNCRFALFLAWKTASRWSDVARLRKKDIWPISETELVVVFPHTKSTVLRPYRPDLLVHVVHKTGLSPLYTYLSRLQPSSPITGWTGERLRAAMRNILLDSSLGTHSIKRGAVQTLVTEAAQGR
eukprot:PhM_4_TR3418/c1_g4_i2/m.82490